MKTKYILFLIYLMVLAGCTNFLDESDPSNFTRDNYFTKPEHAESIVNSIYQDLWLHGGGDYGGNPYFMTDFQTGLANTRVGQNQHINNIRTLTNNSDNSYSRAWWEIPYRAVANANMAIKHIPEIVMEEKAKAQLLGQAHFMRAFNYFNMVRIFGSIPLMLEPVDATSPNLYPEQASVEEIYDAIVSDLKTAEKSGLPWKDKSGRADLTATKSLLSYVYVTMAGYPLQKGNEYYALGATKAKEVIDNESTYLFDEYSDLHSIERDNEGEHIFMMQHQSGIVENRLQYLYLPLNEDISYYSTEPGTIYAIEDFINSYEPGDKRTEEQQFYYTKYTSNTDRSKVVEFGLHHIFKFFDEDAHLNTAQSSLNYSLLRYTDIVLLYAEALNESEGPNSDSYYWVNKIRERANLNPLDGLTKEQLREAIWKERYHELAFENKVWFDMVRTRKVLNLEDGTFNDFVGHQFTYGPTLKERELLFPIPTSELNNNKKLVQNKGY